MPEYIYEELPLSTLDPTAARFYRAFQEGYEYRIVRVQDSIAIAKHTIIKQDADDQDPVILDLDKFYAVCELAIDELREGSFAVGMWREHHVESLVSIAQDALTIHKAIRVVKEVLDPREGVV